MCRVSVIIPNYNCEKWLARTINSCLDQKECLKEIIIVDDYSSDNSWGLISSYASQYPGIIKIFKNKSKGGNHARNYGFELSSGDFVQWLDADDQLVENKFKEQLKLFENDELIDIAYSDWELITYNSNLEIIKKEEKKNKEQTDFLYELLVDNWSAPHCYLLKRRIAQKMHELKAWNPETKVWQDREYYTLAAIEGANFSYSPGCFAVYNRWNKSSVSAASIETRYLSLEKILTRFEKELDRQHWIQLKNKKKYLPIINTQKILIKAAGFPSLINHGSINFFTVEWSMVKGIRTKLRVIKEILIGNVNERNN
jgi:glycosyltransferase involved in cell wall biosynthesis